MATKLDTALGEYLKHVKQYPLLTPDEERELGTKIQAAANAGEMLSSGALTHAEYERMQRSAAVARERMIQANLRLVISVAKNFRNRGLPMEDLVEEGNVGLVNAVDRFDPTVGSRFSTYASYWIDQAIRRAVQNASQMIHIPSYLMEQIGNLRLAKRELEAELGREPSLIEVAAHMKVTPRKATAIVHAIRACACPRGASGGEDSASAIGALPDRRTPQPHEATFSKSEEAFVMRILSQITDREATVLRMRYGLDDQEGRRMTLKDIGAAVGLTRERVRQIEKEAKAKLEQMVREEYG